MPLVRTYSLTLDPRTKQWAVGLLVTSHRPPALASLRHFRRACLGALAVCAPRGTKHYLSTATTVRAPQGRVYVALRIIVPPMPHPAFQADLDAALAYFWERMAEIAPAARPVAPQVAHRLGYPYRQPAHTTGRRFISRAEGEAHRHATARPKVTGRAMTALLENTKGFARYQPLVYKPQ